MNITIIVIIISRVVIDTGELRDSHDGAQERGGRNDGKREGEIVGERTKETAAAVAREGWSTSGGWQLRYPVPEHNIHLQPACGAG